MNEEEAINILTNCIDDYVIGDFCVGKFCPMENECKDKECVFHQAIETVLNLIEKQQKEINNLKEIEEEHKKENGKLKKEIEKLKGEQVYLKVEEMNKIYYSGLNTGIESEKQKIKDKIERYKELQLEYINKYDEDSDTINGMINVMKELLEERS